MPFDETKRKRPYSRRASPEFRPRIGKLVRKACELLSSGTCKTISDTARHLGCSREHLSNSLTKPHVKAYLARNATWKTLLAVERAAQVKIDLLDTASAAVRSDVASEILALNGIAPPKRNDVVQVTLANVSPGYVIKLDAPGEEPRDIAPEPSRRLVKHQGRSGWFGGDMSDDELIASLG